MMERLEVQLEDRSYPIWIGPGAVQQLPVYLQEAGIDTRRKLFMITDENVAPLYLDLVKGILVRGGYQVDTAIVPGGERAKSLEVYGEMMTKVLEAGLDRKSAILALGGGVVGDLTGFVAATYMRGVDFVQIPTTLLAHDSSVGGKVAVNHPLAKNIIGAFHQPKLVCYDTNFLKTLPPRELAAGFSEMVKHGLIWDEQFVQWLDDHAESLWNLDDTLIQEALYRACSVKVAVVSQDERENGLRAILNLGHTFGHAIESLLNYETLNHGEAVAIGMVGAALLAEKAGLAHNISDRVRNLLKKYHLPTSLEFDLSVDDMIEVMHHDKKGESGKLVFIVPRKIGEVEIRRDIDENLVREVLSLLKEGV